MTQPQPLPNRANTHTWGSPPALLYPTFIWVGLGWLSLSQSQETANPGCLAQRSLQGSCDHLRCRARPYGAETSMTRHQGPSARTLPTSGLTCYAGHTSRNGGPGSPGTAHTMCTVYNSRRALASPGKRGTQHQAPTGPIPRTPSSLISLAPPCAPQPHTPGIPPCWDFFLLGLFKSQSWVTLPWLSHPSPLGVQGGCGKQACTC